MGAACRAGRDGGDAWAGCGDRRFPPDDEGWAARAARFVARWYHGHAGAWAAGGRYGTGGGDVFERAVRVAGRGQRGDSDVSAPRGGFRRRAVPGVRGDRGQRMVPAVGWGELDPGY